MEDTSKQTGRIANWRIDSDSFSSQVFCLALSVFLFDNTVVFYGFVCSKDAVIFYDAWDQLCQASFCFIEDS